MAQGIEFTREEREKIKADILQHFLKMPGGTFSAACNAAGISFAEAYRWRKDEPEFDAAVIQAREASHDLGGDFAESKLMKAINEDNLQAVFFYLKSLHKKRGYGETQTLKIGGDADNPEPIKTAVTTISLPPSS